MNDNVDGHNGTLIQLPVADRSPKTLLHQCLDKADSMECAFVFWVDGNGVYDFDATGMTKGDLSVLAIETMAAAQKAVSVTIK